MACVAVVPRTGYVDRNFSGFGIPAYAAVVPRTGYVDRNSISAYTAALIM